MERDEHMPEATACPGSRPCHPPGQPGGLLLSLQLPRGRLPYPSTAQGCCPHQLVQVRKLLPAPEGDRVSVHLQVLAGSQCQKDALLGCNFRGEPMVSTAGVTSQAESHQNRRAHPVLATATWGWRLHMQLREHPHHLTRISISMVLQAGNTNVINSLTHIKQKWGSLSISDGSPKAGRVPKAISEAGSALRRTPCQPRAQPPQGNTIPCYCPGKMSIFN